MGLFSWLFGNRGRVTVRDWIWLKNDARRDGVIGVVKRSFSEGRSLLVVAQFPATLAVFEQHVVSHGWPAVTVPDGLTPVEALALAADSAPRLLLGLGCHLRAYESAPTGDEPASPLPVIALERHPVRSYDDQVVAFAGGLGSRAEVEFHISFDDPLMQMYAGNWARGMLGRLGAKGDKPLGSPMVSRSIKSAQRRLAARLTGDQEADSAEEWIRRNWAG